MTWLQKLKNEKEASDKYNDEQARLKLQIKLINDLYSILDGEFLKELEKFTEKFKQK